MGEPEFTGVGLAELLAEGAGDKKIGGKVVWPTGGVLACWNGWGDGGWVGAGRKLKKNAKAPKMTSNTPKTTIKITGENPFCIYL